MTTEPILRTAPARETGASVDGATAGAPNARHLLTVDIEDYYQVSAFEPVVPKETWDDYPSRVVANTQRVLEVLERQETRATFFVLGWVARRHPELVCTVHRAGHEIACHGFWHRLVYAQTPAEFRADLVQARDLLEDLIGAAVTAYRAPSYSIIRSSEWALEVLVEEGFRADLSIMPARHDRYGIPDAPRDSYVVETAAGPIWEFPPAVVSLGPLAMPVGGGGYFRLFPLWWTCHFLRRMERQGRLIVSYVHPWEFDPDQPRMPLSWKNRLRTYIGLRRAETRLQSIMQQPATWSPIRDMLQSLRACAAKRPPFCLGQGG